MRAVGRGVTEQAAFAAQLGASHRMRVHVRLLDLWDGKEVADLTPRLLDGQVDIDATAETTRSCQLTINDPDHALHLDSRGLGDGAVYLDRMVAITYGVYVEKLKKWLDAPIFTGPVTGLARDGTSLNMTCLGKEHLAKGNAWSPMTFKRDHDTVAAIRAILSERAGERSFSFPAKGGRLSKPLSLGRMTQPWATARKLASSMGRQLYYDGAGVCTLRATPASLVWTFRSGNGGTVLTLPDVTYDVSSVSNLVWTRGAKVGKKQVEAWAIAPRNHPLSPWALGRNGVPRYLVTQADNDQLRTATAAKDYASARLAGLLREGVQVSFDAMPVPHLDPMDLVRVDTGDVSISFALQQASIPLVHSGVMSVGINRRVTPTRGRGVKYA